MNPNREAEPRFDEPFDRWIRHHAPTVRPPDDHRDTLRMILLSNHLRKHPPHRHHWIRIAAVGLAGVAFLVVFTNWQDLGSDGFEVVQHGLNRFKTVLEGHIWGRLHDIENPAEQAATIEAIRDRQLAGEEALRHVYGWTIGNDTFFNSEYEYTVDGQAHAITEKPFFPDREPTPDQSLFIYRHATAVGEMIQKGQARYLGILNRVIDGEPIRFQRWAVTIPGEGTVVFWEGEPLRQP